MFIPHLDRWRKSPLPRRLDSGVGPPRNLAPRRLAGTVDALPPSKHRVGGVLVALVETGTVPDLAGALASYDPSDAGAARAMHAAARLGRLPMLAALIRAGVSVEATDAPASWRPVHTAVEHGQLECVRALCAGGADVNAPADAGMTPLHLAVDVCADAASQTASSADLSMIRLLLELGADANRADAHGRSPEDWAREAGLDAFGLTNPHVDRAGTRPAVNPRLHAAVARFAGLEVPRRTNNPFRLICSVSDPATEAEVAAAWPAGNLPHELMDLWRIVRTARLFEDADYGQWGLVLLAPQASARRTATELRERPEDLQSGDVVIGEFLGDQELLVLAPAERGARRLLVALPLDPRADWYGVGAGLTPFLRAYFDAGGEKFWE